VSFWKVPDINWFVLLYLSEPDCYCAYDDDPRDDVDVLSPSYVLGGYIWEYTDNDLGLNLYILYVYPYTIVSGAGNGFPQTIHFRKQICFHSMRTGTRLAVRVVCVCVCVFLRHTSKYRLALLRTVCVRARERLGKKEGKIHSWGWWCLTNGSWWCLMNGSFTVGSRIHNYTMFFWIGKWRKHRSVSTNNLLVPYTHSLSKYIHTYIHTYIHMNVKTSPLLTRVPLSVLTSGATVCTNCPGGKFSETPGVFTLFWCIESCADCILYARRWRRVLSRIELVQD